MLESISAASHRDVSAKYRDKITIASARLWL